MIECKNIFKVYNKHGERVNAVDGFSGEIKKGEIVAIMGDSGAGKSTLLHIMSGIDTATSGEVLWDGVDICSLSEMETANFRRNNIGIVMQDYALINNYKVYENLMLPMSFNKMTKAEKMARCEEVLESLGMKDFLKRKVKRMSGGEKQRIAIARALINHPKAIFADEPTGSLDSRNSNEVMSIFKKLNAEGITVIIVTHADNIAEQCNRTIRLHKGKMV
jgi:putative ABC transport system ATP-binding protein